MIDAKVIGKTNACFGIQYELGGIMILDDLCELELSEMTYIQHNLKNDIVQLRLKVYASDADYSKGKTHFTYYLGGEEICTTFDQVQMFDLVKREKQINGFKWLEIEGMEPEEYFNQKKKDPPEEKDEKTPVTVEKKSEIPSLEVK